MASEMLMKRLSLLCNDDFVDLDKNIIQKIFTNHFSELLEDSEILQKPLRPCLHSNIERMVKCRTSEAGFSLFECPHCHEDGVRVDVCESIIDFMKKLILHVPDDQFKMIRYYVIYASVKKKTRALVKVMTQRLFRISPFKKNWRDLLIHTFHRDPLQCRCGHYMEFLECYVP